MKTYIIMTGKYELTHLMQESKIVKIGKSLANSERPFHSLGASYYWEEPVTIYWSCRLRHNKQSYFNRHDLGKWLGNKSSTVEQIRKQVSYRPAMPLNLAVGVLC